MQKYQEGEKGLAPRLACTALEFYRKYTVVQKKETVLLSTSLTWLTWAGRGWVELIAQPGPNISA